MIRIANRGIRVVFGESLKQLYIGGSADLTCLIFGKLFSGSSCFEKQSSSFLSHFKAFTNRYLQ